MYIYLPLGGLVKNICMDGYGKEQSEIMLPSLFSFLFLHTVLSLIQKEY